MNAHANHTPAPWSLEGDGSIVMSGQVVEQRIGPDGATEQELLANAQLISAAPELLAALETAVAYHRQSPYYKQWSAAIAKAKGQV